ncbi:hypothetical protein FHT80_005764 [Rhizobium sp. BK226]|jgi:hypothetical protein|uniref:hypothetical protein n=1 Tax=Rhizobium sp. BK226 TaxID=2587075 RepID=UPI00160A3D2F|nr:hypothetical protein [Rhizobium sp. BK226]MBB4116390.1 hypothetical protein [Rhizobium sp. BK226]
MLEDQSDPLRDPVSTFSEPTESGTAPAGRLISTRQRKQAERNDAPPIGVSDSRSLVWHP